MCGMGEEGLPRIVWEAKWANKKGGRQPTEWVKVVEDVWKGLDIDEDETLETEGLQGYRREADVRAVGAVRAPRVIHAGHRPPTSCSPCCSASSSSSPSSSCSSSSSSCSSSLFSTGGGCRRETLGYDAWVCFWLCEEALRSGTCSRRDVRYCFALLDEGNLGRVGVREVEPFIEDAQDCDDSSHAPWAPKLPHLVTRVERKVSSGGSEDISSATETAFARFQDSVGVKQTSDCISLQEWWWT
ncbi:unnamed protein product [Ectocarpus sp. CCAP 1310/34]|nr:unnamed protein product [Ectocarpus sp. CCAP 1310/34]